MVGFRWAEERSAGVESVRRINILPEAAVTRTATRKTPTRPRGARLFRDAVRGVKPLGPAPPPPARPRVRPRARFTRADRAAVLRESLDARDNDPGLAAGDELVYYRPEIQPMVVRRLRRGEYACSARSTCTG